MKICRTRTAALIICAALITGMVLTLPLWGDSGIYGGLIRLHVIAESDSEHDQALKLTVRDAVLETVGAIVEGCSTKDEAEEVIFASLDVIRAAAEKTLRENGSGAEVTVEFSPEYYPTREYESFRLPAGKYTSLRVKLGSAEGRNWWCVLFPPLCLNSSVKAEEQLVQAGFTPNQIRILTESENPRYVLRFKLLEIFGRLFDR